MFQAAYWLHAAIVIGVGLLHFWLWGKSGFRVPFYIHVLAVLAFFMGIVVIFLGQQSGGKPVDWRSIPVVLIFPAIVYIAFVFYGGAQEISSSKSPKTPQQTHPLEDQNPFDDSRS